MAKRIPFELEEHILPFNRDVRRVWELEAAIVQRTLERFEHLLDLPLWSSRPKCGMLFDIAPREVLASPGISPHQNQRIHDAQIEFPIDLLRYQGREWVLDGLHRIAKLIAIGEKTVRVRGHHEKVIPSVKKEDWFHV